MCVTCATSYQLSSHSQAPFLLSNKSPDFKLAKRPHSPALCTAEGGWLPGYVPTSKLSEVETNYSAQSWRPLQRDGKGPSLCSAFWNLDVMLELQKSPYILKSCKLGGRTLSPREQSTTGLCLEPSFT